MLHYLKIKLKYYFLNGNFNFDTRKQNEPKSTYYIECYVIKYIFKYYMVYFVQF